jgi:hypothetical protein
VKIPIPSLDLLLSCLAIISGVFIIMGK